MIMHLEMDEQIGTSSSSEEGSNSLSKSGATFYRFGRLRGSAIVDERTGKVKEYKLPLLDINNSQYVGRIQVGTPKRGTKQQEFDVIFDTGSSNLWLNSDQCPSEGCLLHRRFHPRNSKTYKKLAIEMSVQFGTGSIEGFLARQQHTDTVGCARALGLARFAVGCIVPVASSHTRTAVPLLMLRFAHRTEDTFTLGPVRVHGQTFG
jgi:hypothetical protein